MANDYSSIITAVATVVLAVVTIAYAYITNRILEQSKRDTKIAYIRSRLENYYIPLSSFFDLCTTDEEFNCNSEDPPTKITFDSSSLELFNKLHKYQYLACPKLKPKMTDFLLMLVNQDTDEKEEALYLLFNRKTEEDSQILTIKSKSDIALFVEIRELVFRDIDLLTQKLETYTN